MTKKRREIAAARETRAGDGGLDARGLRFKTEEFCTRCGQRTGMAELADEDLRAAVRKGNETIRQQAAIHSREVVALAVECADLREGLRDAIEMIAAVLRKEETPADLARLLELRELAGKR